MNNNKDASPVFAACYYHFDGWHCKYPMILCNAVRWSGVINKKTGLTTTVIYIPRFFRISLKLVKLKTFLSLNKSINFTK